MRAVRVHAYDEPPGITAYHAVRKPLPLLYPGTHCVVVGAGGLGHIGIQSLRALTPTEITVVDPNPEALELAEQIGAHHTVLADGAQVDQVARSRTAARRSSSTSSARPGRRSRRRRCSPTAGRTSSSATAARSTSTPSRSSPARST